VSAAQLGTIAISNFRSVRGKIAIPLNAPVVLLHGTNGAGKSTVMSALELALTGSVSGIDTPASEHLVHRGAQAASIELTTADATVEFLIERARLSGTPLLDAEDRRFFDERCYLQQRTLGRLLELYESPAEGGESALTAFVKDLLGLDELDALINGLYPVTDKRRVKRLVPEYADLEHELDNTRQRISRTQSDLRKIGLQAAEIRSRLRELLAALNAPPALGDDLDGARDWLQHGSGDAERALVALVGARRELTSLSGRVAALAERPVAQELAAIEAASTAARTAADAWRASHGAALEAVLDELRKILPGTPAATGAADPAAIRAAALEQLNAELERLTAALQADELARTEAGRLDQAIVAAQSRLAALDEQIATSATATAAEELGKALAALIPHVHTDDCPVCGRDYSEVSREPLSAHLAARVSDLGAEAERLQELAGARLQALADLRQLEDDRRAAGRGRLEPEAKLGAQDRLSRIENAQRQLVAFARGVAEGPALIRKETEAARALAQARDLDRASAELRSATETIAASVGRAAPTGATPLANAIAALADQVNADIKALEEQSSFRTGAAEAIQQLTRAIDEQRRLEDEIKTAQAAVDRTATAIAELERQRSVMRKLRDEAEAARVRIVRRVFTESLNRVWRDLFVRLAPEEPFVPQFRVPDVSQRVAATLETMHRDGKPGGPPAAMLSAGNLNTAALTLFLALNLAVEQRLPWILLDDPVQSMDEVHVAQFAALLRTLARQHQRRIVIAVHERALFEYLSLELSPANPDDSLITVELTRAQDGSTLVQPSFQTYVEDRALEAV
jgi:DNA repair protein SbcC/Rad50